MVARSGRDWRRLLVALTRRALTPSGLVLAVAAALGIMAVLGVAAKVTGTAAVVLATAYLHLKTTHLDETGRRRAAEHTRLIRELDEARSAVAALTAETGRLAERADTQRDKLRSQRARITKLERIADRRRERLQVLEKRTTANRNRITRASTLTRVLGESLRAEITGSRLPDRDWDDVPATTADGSPPVLSIAIPGFNRPEKLEMALESIIDQIEDGHENRVEIVITDDRSVDRRATALAHQFALDHPYIGFRHNPVNLGLERNLIRCTDGCSGDYVWVFGNDDLLGPGALDALLPELEEGAYDIFLVDKERISRDGEPVEFRPGTRPATTSADYDSILAMAEITGLISSFGWISQIIRRRAPYVAVDPEPYFDTTLHPHIAMLLEAFPSSPVAFRAIVGVIHRTQDPRERLAESAGRHEASYMAGGKERDSTWFGAGYAAMLQRVVDRTSITAADLARLNEAQWHEGSMFDWIAENWQWGLDHGLDLDADLLADAERLFTAAGRPVPTPG